MWRSSTRRRQCWSWRGLWSRRWSRDRENAGLARLLTGDTSSIGPDDLRIACLTFRGSEETFPFGFETSVFKVAGKMFALSRLDGDPLSVSLKCEPLLAEQLREAHPAITGGYHLNKRHWNTVLLDGSLDDQMVIDMIEDSYDLVVSKLPLARRRALGAAARG